MQSPQEFRLNFVGDVMLGRLIDQLMPTHVYNPTEAKHLKAFQNHNPELQSYTQSSPWDTTLSLFHSGSLNLMNLETAATTSSKKWPEKAFNYRMHPSNIASLHIPPIDYAGLANNHTLDFCKEGLLDTVHILKEAKIAFAGAGESREEATRPAVLELPRAEGRDEKMLVHQIHIYAASDHPSVWASEPGFHLIDYSPSTKERLKQLLTSQKILAPDIKIFSVHWGPNYAWQPAAEIRDMAHFLIDECGVDIIHGHSSHHVQGVETYKGKLIIYGCGDFVDDYAVSPGYRNNLSAVWRVTISENGGNGQKKLSLKSVEVFPTEIYLFQARVLDRNDADHEWVVEKATTATREYGGTVREHGPVTDWKSGGVVASKSFGYGFYDGITGFVTQPMAGAKKDGALGFATGLAKGSVELFTKPGAAMFGLVAYPAIGLYKSMNSGKLSPTGVQILQARKMLSVYVNEQKGVQEDEARRVQLIFESKAKN